MPENEDYTLIHKFRKNAQEIVYIGLTEYRGHPLIDIRSYYEAADGDFRPTPKGIMFSQDALPELEKAVERLRAAIAGEQES